MCGIVAIVAGHGTSDAVSKHELRRIRDHMAPRGPDGLGEWYTADGRVGLGQRRLAIVDTSNAGDQPMRVQDVTITFHGEIYNHESLRQKLQMRGHRFFSRSDTEVLLRMYIESGPRMLHELRGMFAFALWDDQKHALLVARDPYGIKPLYYTQDSSGVRVASQVKALLAGGHVSRNRDPAGVVGLYLFGSVPEPFTYFEAIRALPAGTYAWADEKGVHEPQRYYSLAKTFAKAENEPSELRASEAQASVGVALRDSVKHHLVSDMSSGAFLSAGIDSSALVALMAEMGQTGTQTFTLAFDEFRHTRSDEAASAEKTACDYALDHRTHVVSAKAFMQAVPAILEAMDQPSVDGMNTWLLSRAVADAGLKVAISGLGGDELFGGYASFQQIPRLVRWARWPCKFSQHGHALHGLYQRLARRLPIRSKWESLFSYANGYAGAYLLKRGVFMPEDLPSVLPTDLVHEGLGRLMPVDHIERSLDAELSTSYARVACLEASNYMRNQLLRDADWASMAHGVELRLPLVDVALLEAVAPILIRPHGPHQASNKMYLARSPSRPLRSQLVRRKKTGFILPIARWIQDPRCGLDAYKAIPSLANPRASCSQRLVYSLDTLLSSF